MTTYAKLKSEKDSLIQAATKETDNKKIDALMKKADKIQSTIDNMTIAEAMREAE